jgi:hypothetical protein
MQRFEDAACPRKRFQSLGRATKATNTVVALQSFNLRAERHPYIGFATGHLKDQGLLPVRLEGRREALGQRQAQCDPLVSGTTTNHNGGVERPGGTAPRVFLDWRDTQSRVRGLPLHRLIQVIDKSEGNFHPRWTTNLLASHCEHEWDLS